MIDTTQHLPEGASGLLDTLAFLAFLAHLIGLALPTILTLVSILWVTTRLIESKSVAWLWEHRPALLRRKPQD